VISADDLSLIKTFRMELAKLCFSFYFRRGDSLWLSCSGFHAYTTVKANHKEFLD